MNIPQKFEQKPDGERYLKANPPSFEISFVSNGLDNINDVDWWAKNRAIPEVWIFAEFGVMFLQGYEIKRMSHKLYEVYATYGPKPVNSWSFQATTHGQNVRIKCGTHIRTYAVTPPASLGLPSTAGSPSGGDANLWQGAIAPNAETNEIEGMDIIVGNVGSFDLLVPMQAGLCDPAYFKQTAQLVGMTNEQPLHNHTFEQGELLYVGSDLPDGRYVPVVAAHHFLFSRNLTNATIQGITAVEKKGFEVAWVEFTRLTDNGRPAMKPVRIHIEKVYEPTTQFIDPRTGLGFPP